MQHRDSQDPRLATRRALNVAFLTALSADFADHGPSAIAALREDNPGRYLDLIASLQPPRNEPDAPRAPVDPFDGLDAAERERRVLAELAAAFNRPSAAGKTTKRLLPGKSSR
ncbi:MAG: hypothetical protein WDO24_23040 [Pseudomonadota bacterium]